MPQFEIQDAGNVLPLRGRRVLVTRAEDQAADFVRRLCELGAEPVLCPTIRIVAPDDYAPLDEAIARLDTFDWLIFTSPNGVRAFAERAAMQGRPLAALPRVATIGPATADALAALGVATDWMPRRHIAEGIVEEIREVEGVRVLLPLADIARRTLADGLRARGATVTTVTAYRTVPVDQASFSAWMDCAPLCDIATFTSSSTVRNFVELASAARAREMLAGSVVACIGPQTAQTAHECGLEVGVVAPEHTTDGLLRALVMLYEREKNTV
jgi:uroporphyrinogen-III synthase